MLTALSLNEFTARLASEASLPGGGSAAAAVGLIAAGTLELAINVTLDRNNQDSRELLQAGLRQVQALRRTLQELVDQDAAAFQQLMTMLTAGQETGAAFRQAAEAPRDIACACLTTLELSQELLGVVEFCVVGDLMVAAAAAHAALTGALCCIAVNLPGITDTVVKEALSCEAGRLRTAANEILTGIQQQVCKQEPYQILGT